MNKPIIFNYEIKFEPPLCKWNKPNWLIVLHMYWGMTSAVLQFTVLSILDKISIENTERMIKKFWQGILISSHTKVEVSGQHFIQEGRPYIYMANHISLIDTPVLFCALKGPLRMLPKIELFRIPLFGHAILKAGFVAIDRRNRIKAIKQLELAKARLKEGISLAIFPEGTRSRDLALLPFKKGGFHIAIELGFPVVPVYIAGAHEVIHPDSTTVELNKTVQVRIGEPIETTGMDKSHIESLVEKTRQELIILSTT